MNRRHWLGTAALLGVSLVARAQGTSPDRRAILERFDAPTGGPPDAKVHIVEFLDPACEACAAFYPFVKKLIADNPGRVRLTVRHVPFHRGADQVVKMLEAARAQNRYWQALEILLANQELWTARHVAQPERALEGLKEAGLDMARLRKDMEAPQVAARMKRDMDDAKALGVTKTPEFFVNGRPLPSHGREQLAALVREELRRAYP